MTSLPAAGLLVSLSSIVEIRVDAWKLLSMHQRPFLKTAEDIGTWCVSLIPLSTVVVVFNPILN